MNHERKRSDAAHDIPIIFYLRHLSFIESFCEFLESDFSGAVRPVGGAIPWVTAFLIHQILGEDLGTIRVVEAAMQYWHLILLSCDLMLGD